MYFCLNPISMKHFIFPIVAIMLLGCNTAKTGDATTYFGGQIINPKSDFVLLLKDDKVIDTLPINKSNKFIKSYNSINEGLYTFKHGTEFQYVYFEPGDSILIRLNTWDFDESLVFSGKGSEKNEFLINFFLKNEKVEKEEKKLYQYFILDEFPFQQKIDSLTKERLRFYNDFSANAPEFSEGFKKLATTALYFPMYRLKEMYPYYYKWAHELDDFPKVSETFYDFRNNINLNEESLVSFYPYQNYVISYLYSLTYTDLPKGDKKGKITNKLLHTISENIELETFKNTLLKRVVVNDFLTSESTCSINTKTLALFEETCTNPEYVAQIKNLVNDSKLVANKNALHNFEITKYNNNDVLLINDVIKNKNTVIYFWSTNFMSSEYLAKRIHYLEDKYPNILFVGINMQPDAPNLSKDYFLQQLNIDKQFKLTENSFAHKFLASKYPRTIIVDKNGIVENGFTYLASKKLHGELKRIEKSNF